LFYIKGSGKGTSYFYNKSISNNSKSMKLSKKFEIIKYRNYMIIKWVISNYLIANSCNLNNPYEQIYNN